MMKVIIAGGRDYNNFQVVEDAVLAHVWTALDELAQPGERAIDVMRDQVEIIQGGAKGADAMGRRFAEKYGLATRVFYPDWDTHGNAAGPIRNKQMAEQGTDLVAFWDYKSHGTKSMIGEARKRNLNTSIVDIRGAAPSNTEWETELKRVVKEKRTPSTKKQAAPMSLPMQTVPTETFKPKDTSPLYFSMGKGKRTEFSNMYMASFEVGGVKYPSAEHYFQAKKFMDEGHQNKIIRASNATEAKQLGKSRRFAIRENWDSLRIKVMKVAMWNKFTQNAKLKQALLDTGDHTLIEDNPSDHFWGIGDGNGKNMTGELLMQLRTKLKKSPSAAGSNETSAPSAVEPRSLSEEEKARDPFVIVIAAPRDWASKSLHWDKIESLVAKVRRPVQVRAPLSIKWMDDIYGAAEKRDWEVNLFEPDEEEQKLDWFTQQNLVNQALIADAHALVAFYAADDKPFNVGDLITRAIHADLPVRKYHKKNGRKIFTNSKPSAVKKPDRKPNQ